MLKFITLWYIIMLKINYLEGLTLKRSVKSLVAGIAVASVMITSVVSYAAGEAKIVLNGTELALDVAPTNVQGRLLVPFRALGEGLGATVNWDNATKTATLTKGDLNVSVVINNKEAKVNGESKTLEVAATVISGRTLVPVRFVSENLGLDVKWDNATKTATINNKAAGGDTTPAAEATTAPAAGGKTTATIDLKYKNIEDGDKEETGKYVGEVVNGVPEGKGVAYWSDNETKRYEGDWKTGKMEGTGIGYFSSGEKKCEGQFANDMANGTVKVYYEDGSLSFEGTVANNEPVKGKGFLGGQLVHDGAWKMVDGQPTPVK